MLGTYPLISMVATQDPERAKAFYTGVLGIPLVAETPFALVMDAAGSMLRISKVRDFTPALFAVLGWRVPDIQAMARELTKKGVIFERYVGMAQDELGIWTSPDGNYVCWFKDPDGNTL